LNLINISQGRAFDYGYIEEDTLNELIKDTTSLSKQIAGFISYLKKCNLKGTKYL